LTNLTVSIPSGKSMIIEHVSGRLVFPSTQLVSISIQTAAFQIDVPGSSTGFHFFPYTVVQPGTLVFGQIAKIRTMGGNIVLTVHKPSPTGTLDGTVTICGELSP